MIDIECFGYEDSSTLYIRLIYGEDEWHSKNECEFVFDPKKFKQLMKNIDENKDFEYENEDDETLKISPSKKRVSFEYDDIVHTFSNHHYDTLLKYINKYFKTFEENEWYSIENEY
jgi:hypothetical protein